MQTVVTGSADETRALGEKIAKILKPGDVVALYGALGAGKTAFTSGIAAAFGIKATSSPTFTLVNEYIGEKMPLYHFDAYRITADDWLNCGFDEYLYGDGVCVIEWSENIEAILPENCIKIRIIRGEAENGRVIEIDAEGITV